MLQLANPLASLATKPDRMNIIPGQSGAGERIRTADLPLTRSMAASLASAACTPMSHESATTAPRTLGPSVPPFHDPFHACLLAQADGLAGASASRRSLPRLMTRGLACGLPRFRVPETASLSGCRRSGSDSGFGVVSWVYVRSERFSYLAMSCAYTRAPWRSRATVVPTLGPETFRSVGVGSLSRSVHCRLCAGPTFHTCRHVVAAVRRLGSSIGSSGGGTADL